MNNKETVKRYLNKYFKSNYLNESDYEFKALVRILNKKDKEVKKSLDGNTVKPVKVCLRQYCPHIEDNECTHMSHYEHCAHK